MKFLNKKSSRLSSVQKRALRDIAACRKIRVETIFGQCAISGSCDAEVFADLSNGNAQAAEMTRGMLWAAA